jgi:putative hemolysin
MDSSQLVAVVTTILASAFFAGVEMAFVSANRLYFELQAKQGILTGTIIASFFKNPSKFIGTMLIGNTLSLVVYGIYMEGYLHHFFEHWLSALPPNFQFLNNDIIGLLLPSVLATILILALAEYLPKSIFMLNPDVFLEVLAIPIFIIYYAMYPLVYVIVSFSKWFIINVLRLDYSENKPVFGLTDLNNYIQNLNKKDNKEEEVAEVDTKIFNNALEFREVKVRDCMIPRTEIVGIDLEETIEDLKKIFVESGHSKVIVYRDTIEDVVGYCHSLALFKKPKDIKSIMTPISIVPEAMPAHVLMAHLSKARKSVAIVVDEFGGTSGLISLEDIMEQIFGEIEDEYDSDEHLLEEKIDEKSYHLSGRLEIDYLNEKYNWNLPEGDYDTLGGLIISVNEDLPEIDELVQLYPFNFTVLSMQDARIDTIRVNIIGEIEQRKTERNFGH